ncbi:MAG TPA: M15 family metallopeptidase [Jiangellales bacterium]|nr:M15 family metallopeptidase [Jiangellales bacterium]
MAPLVGLGLLAGTALALDGGDEVPQPVTASAAAGVPEVDLTERVGSLTRPSRAQSREPARPTAPPEPPLPAEVAAPVPEPVAVPVPAPAPEPAGLPPVPGCDAAVPEDGAVANGRLGDAHLCPVGDGHRLRPDAAAAYLALAAAYQAALGSAPCLTDSYRSLSAQQDLAERKPRLAARPGTSEHGWGMAVDLGCGVESYRSAEHRWLVDHAPAYGWVNPGWARPGGSRPEPWHWEYVPDGAG